MALLAVRLIDLAIFGSLGGLWIVGALFIVTLYRWIRRYERETSVPEATPVARLPSTDVNEPVELVTERAA